MPNEKTDPAGFNTESQDKDTSDAAIGDTTTNIGKPGLNYTHPNTVDTATKLAALSQKPADDDNVGPADSK